jgi:hypothetical protein
MSEKTEPRTRIADLPVEEKELNPSEMDQVKGGVKVKVRDEFTDAGGTADVKNDLLSPVRGDVRVK